MADRKKKTEEMRYEEVEKRLTEIVGELEKGEAVLDEMLRLYEEGTALLRRANALLAEAEERVKTVEKGVGQEF